MARNGMNTLELQNSIISNSTQQLTWIDAQTKVVSIAEAAFFFQMNKIFTYLMSGVSKTVEIVNNVTEIDDILSDLRTKTNKTRQDKADLKSLESKIFIDINILQQGARAAPRATPVTATIFKMWGRFLVDRLKSPTKNRRIINKILLELFAAFQSCIDEQHRISQSMYDLLILAIQQQSTAAGEELKNYLMGSAQEGMRSVVENSKKKGKKAHEQQKNVMGDALMGML